MNFVTVELSAHVCAIAAEIFINKYVFSDKRKWGDRPLSHEHRTSVLREILASCAREFLIDRDCVVVTECGQTPRATFRVNNGTEAVYLKLKFG